MSVKFSRCGDLNSGIIARWAPTSKFCTIVGNAKAITLRKRSINTIHCLPCPNEKTGEVSLAQHGVYDQHDAFNLSVLVLLSLCCKTGTNMYMPSTIILPASLMLNIKIGYPCPEAIQCSASELTSYLKVVQKMLQ